MLESGFRVYADRHENSGGFVLLYIKGGVTTLPASQVVRFEQEDYVAPPPAPPTPEPAKPFAPPDPKTLVKDAAGRYALPAKFVESVAAVESGFKTDAVSRKGALGVMQLMPATAQTLNADPKNPADNIDAGTRYLRELLIKYNGDVIKALAAYNAGPGAVDRYNGLPPYPETQDYVGKVLKKYQQADGGN